MDVSGGKMYVVPLIFKGCEVEFVVFTSWESGWQIRRVSIYVLLGSVRKLQGESTYYDSTAALQFEKGTI